MRLQFIHWLDAEIAEMILNQGIWDNSDDEDDIVNTAEKCLGPLDEIMSLYKIREKLLRKKLLLMKQMTPEETFLKVIQQNASSSRFLVSQLLLMFLVTPKNKVQCTGTF